MSENCKGWCVLRVTVGKLGDFVEHQRRPSATCIGHHRKKNNDDGGGGNDAGQNMRGVSVTNNRHVKVRHVVVVVLSSFIVI